MASTRRSSGWIWPGLFLLLAAGCLLDNDPEEIDRARLTQLRSEIDAMIGVPQCADSSACAAIAFGSKPCGGPWEYLVYSKASTDSAALAAKVRSYNSLEERFNRKNGWVSDCSVPPAPRLACVDGRCVDLNRE